jgi:hypothetical protein
MTLQLGLLVRTGHHLLHWGPSVGQLLSGLPQTTMAIRRNLQNFQCSKKKLLCFMTACFNHNKLFTENASNDKRVGNFHFSTNFFKWLDWIQIQFALCIPGSWPSLLEWALSSLSLSLSLSLSVSLSLFLFFFLLFPLSAQLFYHSGLEHRASWPSCHGGFWGEDSLSVPIALSPESTFGCKWRFFFKGTKRIICNIPQNIDLCTPSPVPFYPLPCAFDYI